MGDRRDGEEGGHPYDVVTSVRAAGSLGNYVVEGCYTVPGDESGRRCALNLTNQISGWPGIGRSVKSNVNQYVIVNQHYDKYFSAKYS